MSLLKENIKYHFLLFFISPVIGLFYGLKSRKQSYIRRTLFIFTVIYGSLFSFNLLGGKGEIGTMYRADGADGARHWNNVYIHYQHLDFNVWLDRLYAIIAFSPERTTQAEPYLHFLSYIVGGLLNAPGLFFVAVSIVFAYFYSGAFTKLLSHVDWNTGYNKFFFNFFLVMLCAWFLPFEMQTVRTWTAGFVLFYAILNYHDTKKKKYLFLALLPPFIHIGFLALALPIWIVLFSGFRRINIYFIIFIISILVSNVLEQTNAIQFIQQTEIGESKTDAYYLDDERKDKYEDSLNKTAQQATFYKAYERYRIHIYVLSGILIFMYVSLKGKGFGDIEKTLFSYALATGAFANFSIAIFAVYNRSWSIAAFLILGLLVIYLSKTNLQNLQFSFIRVRLPLFLFVLVFIPYLLYFISNFLRFTSINILVLPLISWINNDASISFRELIGIIL